MQRARSWRRWALLAAEEEEVVLEEVVVLSKVPLAVEEMGKFGTRAAWSVVVDRRKRGICFWYVSMGMPIVNLQGTWM